MKSIQKVKLIIAGVAMVLAGVVAVVPTHAACSADCTTGCTPSEQTVCFAELAGKGTGHTNDFMPTLVNILNAVFGVIGFIAVVMLVYGGIQYTISSGDAGKVKKAKDTILYGIVGLVIALLAAAIVNFVLVNMLGSK